MFVTNTAFQFAFAGESRKSRKKEKKRKKKVEKAKERKKLITSSSLIQISKEKICKKDEKESFLV